MFSYNSYSNQKIYLRHFDVEDISYPYRNFDPQVAGAADGYSVVEQGADSEADAVESCYLARNMAETSDQDANNSATKYK